MDKEYARKYRAEHRDQINTTAAKYREKNRDKLRIEQKKYNSSDKTRAYDKERGKTMGRRLMAVKFRAKKDGRDFDLTMEWASALPLICFYTGKPLTMEHYQKNTISFERVDNNGGYTQDNTVLCCHYINIAKKAMTEQEFLGMCEDIVNWQKKKKLKSASK